MGHGHGHGLTPEKQKNGGFSVMRLGTRREHEGVKNKNEYDKNYVLLFPFSFLIFLSFFFKMVRWDLHTYCLSPSAESYVWLNVVRQIL